MLPMGIHVGRVGHVDVWAVWLCGPCVQSGRLWTLWWSLQFLTPASVSLSPGERPQGAQDVLQEQQVPQAHGPPRDAVQGRQGVRLRAGQAPVRPQAEGAWFLPTLLPRCVSASCLNTFASLSQGFGGQTKPVFHKKAKTTKKIVLRLECKICKERLQVCRPWCLVSPRASQLHVPMFDLTLHASACSCVCQLPIRRCKHFELGASRLVGVFAL